ncbi:MAG TPA: hypothetical protein VLM91_29010 [Candidatus Methylomirabilis sp.]|nr:hypothetical protein [Candidatus Methylomirabilis sp.]
MWEHVVIEYLQAHAHTQPIHYWRDASGREIAFVVPHSRDRVDAIECRWDPASFDPTSLKIFRSHYPRGANYIASQLGTRGYAKKVAGLEVYVCNPDGWWERAKARGPRDFR